MRRIPTSIMTRLAVRAAGEGLADRVVDQGTGRRVMAVGAV